MALEGSIAAEALQSVHSFLAAIGSSLSGPGLEAVTALLETLEAGLNGELEPAYFLSSIDPGMGKTLSVSMFLKAWKGRGYSPTSSILIGVSRLSEIRAYVDTSGLAQADFGVLTSDTAANALGVPAGRHGTAPILFTTQQMIESRTRNRSFGAASEFHYQDEARQLRIWDESLIPGHPQTLSLDQLGLLASPLRIRHRTFVEAVEELQETLRQAKPGEISTRQQDLRNETARGAWYGGVSVMRAGGNRLMRVAARALLGLAAIGGASSAIAQSSASAYTTGYRYDAARRLAGTISPDPDGSGPLHYAAVRNTYNSAGQLVTVEKGELSSWQPETVAPSAWPVWNGTSGFQIYSTATTIYDGMGRKVTETLTGTANGVTSTALTQYSYDYLGQLECTAVRMNPLVYGSLPQSACSLSNQGTDGPDRITKNTYDAAGRLTLVQKAYGTPDQASYAAYTYTANGKQQTLTDANGNLATMTYDGFDRQIAWAFPSAANGTVSASCTIGTVSETNGITAPSTVRNATDDCEKYGYDDNSNRAALIKRDGTIIRYWYDALNRVTRKCVVATLPGVCTAPNGPNDQTPDIAIAHDVYYTYDAEGRQKSALFDADGGPDGVTNGYDGYGELTSTRLVMSAAGFDATLRSQYDADGNRTQLIHPENIAGHTIRYDYDGLDRLKAIYEGVTTATPIDQFTYNPAELPASRSEGVTGASSVAYTWDGIGRLGTQTDSFSGGPGTVNWTLGYNPASQITSDGRDNSAYVFQTSLIGNPNRDYTVNGLNQYVKTSTAGVTNTTFGYDANANLTSDGVWAYTYDDENRLVQAVSAGGTVTLTYDPLGRLFETSKSTPSTTTRFLYDGDAMVIQYNGSNAISNRYVHGSNAAADDPLLWYSGGALMTKNWLHADHLGSIVAITDSTGANPVINTYDEYGINGAGNSQTERFGYTGQAWIPELNLYYYKARFYSPNLGRFLQTDPIGYEGGVNLYGYVGDDPTDETDPSGNVGFGPQSTGDQGTSADGCDSNPTCRIIWRDDAGSAQRTPIQHRINPLLFIGGETGPTEQDAVEEAMVDAGQMTQSEHRERQLQRFNGVAIGLSLLDGAILTRSALKFGVSRLSAVVRIEGAGKAARFGTGRMGQIRFGGGRLILRLDRPPRTGGYYHLNIESHSWPFNFHIPLNPMHWFGL